MQIEGWKYGRVIKVAKEKTSNTGSVNHLHAGEQIYSVPDSFFKGECSSDTGADDIAALRLGMITLIKHCFVPRQSASMTSSLLAAFCKLGWNFASDPMPCGSSPRLPVPEHQSYSSSHSALPIADGSQQWKYRQETHFLYLYQSSAHYFIVDFY